MQALPLSSACRCCLKTLLLEARYKVNPLLCTCAGGSTPGADTVIHVQHLCSFRCCRQSCLPRRR